MEAVLRFCAEHWEVLVGAAGALVYVAAKLRAGKKLELAELLAAIKGAIKLVSDLRATDPVKAQESAALLLAENTRLTLADVYDVVDLTDPAKPDIDEAALAQKILSSGTGKDIQRKVRNELKDLFNSIKIKL